MLGFEFEMTLIGLCVGTLGSRGVIAILGRNFERWSLAGVTRGVRPLEVTDLPCFLSLSVLISPVEYRLNPPKSGDKVGLPSLKLF